MIKSGYRDLLRRKLRDDIDGPQLFSNDELDEFIQESRIQAALRDRLCRIGFGPKDSTDAAQFVMGDATRKYPLDDTFFRITDVFINEKKVDKSTEEDFEYYRYLEKDQAGEPRCFIVDQDWNLVFDRAPELGADYTIRLEGFKEPHLLAADDDQDLEIKNSSAQTKLIYHAMSLAYLMQDSEVEHVQKSQLFEAKFIEEFGDPITKNQRRLQGQYRRRTTRYGGL